MIGILGISIGKLLFLSGIGMFILAIISSLVFGFSAPWQKRKIEKRMREKY